MRIEGTQNPVTVVITYQGVEYRKTGRTMCLGQVDGMPVGDLRIADHVYVSLSRVERTIIATVNDHGHRYTLRP